VTELFILVQLSVTCENVLRKSTLISTSLSYLDWPLQCTASCLWCYTQRCMISIIKWWWLSVKLSWKRSSQSATA